MARSNFFYVSSTVVVIVVSLMASMERANEEARVRNRYQQTSTKETVEVEPLNITTTRQQPPRWFDDKYSCRPFRDKKKTFRTRRRRPILLLSSPHQTGSGLVLDLLATICQKAGTDKCHLLSYSNFLGPPTNATRHLLKTYSALQHNCPNGVPPRDDIAADTFHVQWKWQQIRTSPSKARKFMEQQVQALLAKDARLTKDKIPLHRWLQCYRTRRSEPARAIQFMVNIPSLDGSVPSLATELFLDQQQAPQLWSHMDKDGHAGNDTSSLSPTPPWPFLTELIQQFPDTQIVVVWRRRLMDGFLTRLEAQQPQSNKPMANKGKGKKPQAQPLLQVNVSKLERYVRIQHEYYTRIRSWLDQTLAMRAKDDRETDAVAVSDIDNNKTPRPRPQILEYQRDLVERDPKSLIEQLLNNVLHLNDDSGRGGGNGPQANVAVTDRFVSNVLKGAQQKTKNKQHSWPAKDKRRSDWSRRVANWTKMEAQILHATGQPKNNKNHHNSPGSSSSFDDGWPDLFG